MTMVAGRGDLHLRVAGGLTKHSRRSSLYHVGKAHAWRKEMRQFVKEGKTVK